MPHYDFLVLGGGSAGFNAAREHYGDGVAFRRLGYMTADDTLTAWYGEEVAR